MIWSPGSKRCNRRVKIAVWVLFRLFIDSNEGNKPDWQKFPFGKVVNSNLIGQNHLVHQSNPLYNLMLKATTSYVFVIKHGLKTILNLRRFTKVEQLCSFQFSFFNKKVASRLLMTFNQDPFHQEKVFSQNFPCFKVRTTSSVILIFRHV